MASSNALLHAAPAGLAGWRGRHADESVLVCGCGVSANAGLAHSRCTTIGVNDIGRLFTPTYLVVVNPPRQFRGDRFEPVRHSRAQALFTHLELGPVNPPVVHFPLGRYGGTDIDGQTLHFTQNSPYVAVCLAAHMGAKRIGLVGVDFSDHHFFAATGRHPLAARLPAIDREYGALAAALAAQGVELCNLSAVSRLQSLPRRALQDFAPGPRLHAVPMPAGATGRQPAPPPAQRVFVVNYTFLTCGDVFADGLRQAAQSLGVEHAEAAWDDPRLPSRVAAFKPDLLLVVHGRRFVQRWGRQFAQWRSAVWLVDEPYEVDDTAAWSGHFDHVFVNDRATLARHHAASYLPMCVDPVCYRDEGLERPHALGFIGGASPTRERFLLPLAEAGLLSYVVGGPWRHPLLRRLVLAARVPHGQTARLYQQTRIVINVFRDQHHYNRAGTPATAMNPRIYEALACGAMVVSERRAEIAEVFPALPQFGTPQELLALVQGLLAAPAELQRRREDCHARLAGHAYADRLKQALAWSRHAEEATAMPAVVDMAMTAAVAAVAPAAPTAPAAPPWPPSQPQAPYLQALSRPVAPSPLALPPLAATPRRHLLYHLWPVRGSTWRWNLAQLLQRLELFNGRRLMAVVTDQRTEEAALVQAELAGHGFEFITLANTPQGEADSFPRLLDQLKDENPGDVCFYAHAKGVKYEPGFPPAVRRWAEVLYAANLDHWPTVREQLERYAMTGALRRLGRFANHQNVGDWHYSGTFFWFRHDAVFGAHSRGPAQPVPQFYGGVEAWPGVMFRRHDAGCLLLDHLRELPYHERFWAQRGNLAFTQWQQALRPLPVPPDLAQPPPFEGHAGVRLEQQPQEWAWWLDLLLARRVRSLVLLGDGSGGHGGEEWHLARRFREAGRDISVTTLCRAPRPELLRAVADARGRHGQMLQVVADAAALPPRCDAVFIDGDHGFRACSADVALALSLQPQLLALHDIVDSDWHAQSRCAVSRVWAQLSRAQRSESRCLGTAWGGIGVVFPDLPAEPSA